MTQDGGVEARSGELAALASLDGLGPRRLAGLLAHHDAGELLATIADGGASRLAPGRWLDAELVRRWRRQLASTPPDQWAQRCSEAGITALTADDAEYPEVLRLDMAPPAVLFVRGSLAALGGRRVAIVGTRNATLHGRQLAESFGDELARARVVVMSGLARGIDAAAHRGALAAISDPAPSAMPAPGVVGVVGNGLDEPYPRQNASLWDAVAERGALLGEWPPGTAPDAFRFPLRNRILAALSEAVIVVESRETGGSLITAVEAAQRGVTVMAVPGDVRARAARGTNALIADGATPVTCVDDVMTALSLDTSRCRPLPFDPRPAPRGDEVRVLERVRSLPCTLDELVTELELPIFDAALVVARLERNGWVRELGGWFEAVGPRTGHS